MSRLSPSVVLNGRRAGAELLRQVALALADPDVLAERGGFLFKATLGEDTAWLDVVPCVMDGVRSYHYNMRMQEENDCTLTGAVNANGIFTIFFSPRSGGLSEDLLAGLRLAYGRMARLLMDNGYPGEGKLDWATLNLLEETGICRTPPSSLRGLAEI